MRTRVSDIHQIVCAINEGDIDWFNNHEIAEIDAQIEIGPFGWDEIFYKTFLDIAAESKCPRILEIIIRDGANVNVQDTYYGRTALHRAAKTGTAEMVNMLLDAGANIDAITIDNKTPLFDAISNSNTDTVKALLVAQAYRKSLAEQGVLLPTHVVPICARVLEARQPTPQKPLFCHAVDSCSIDLSIVRALIELDPDIDINMPDRFESTALDYALDRFNRPYQSDTQLEFNKNVVIFLLRLGAQPQKKLTDYIAQKLSDIKAEIKREDDTLAVVRTLRFDRTSFFYHVPEDIVKSVIEPYATRPAL